MPDKKKNKGGRPTKFSPEIKKQVKILALKGFTDAEMSEVIGVTEQTFNNWKKRSVEFFESLKDAKAEADKRVERSLYERACGYSHPEDKIFCTAGIVTIEPTIKHYPPSEVAAIFWLKNRQPDKWRDVKQVEAKVEHDLTESLRKAAFAMFREFAKGK